MLLQLSEQIGERYRHAKEARRTADVNTNPNTKVEPRWLAHSYELNDPLTALACRKRRGVNRSCSVYLCLFWVY